MKFNIVHQPQYSRGELLLRTFFGWLYIAIPHYFLMFFYRLWGSLLTFIAFWSILFTGRYPQSFFEFHEDLLHWEYRVEARLMHLSDGYPPFFTHGSDDHSNVHVPYPEQLSRGHALLKLLFGWLYCGVPHGVVLFFRYIWSGILIFLAFWVVLFTGEYPKSWHEFNVGTLRWSARVGLYLGFMTDEYPPFSGK